MVRFPFLLRPEDFLYIISQNHFPNLPDRRMRIGMDRTRGLASNLTKKFGRYSNVSLNVRGSTIIPLPRRFVHQFLAEEFFRKDPSNKEGAGQGHKVFLIID